MTDIVERLRSGTTDGTALTWTVTPIHREAAAQIERLRAALERLQEPDGRRDDEVADWLRARGYTVEAPPGWMGKQWDGAP